MFDFHDFILDKYEVNFFLVAKIISFVERRMNVVYDRIRHYFDNNTYHMNVLLRFFVLVNVSTIKKMKQKFSQPNANDKCAVSLKAMVGFCFLLY